MDAVPRLLQDLTTRWRALTPARRGLVTAAPVAVLLLAALLLLARPQSGFLPVAGGRIFTADEQSAVSAQLRGSGLSGFRFENGRLMVPAAEAGRYPAALADDSPPRSDWAADWEKQSERVSIFAPRQQIEETREIARAKQVRQILVALPDVQDANVIWASSAGRPRWSGGARRVTATVSVLPKKGVTLAPSVLNSMRHAVAGMVPDLSPDDVTIFDQSTGLSYTGGSAGDDDFMARADHYIQMLRHRILQTVDTQPQPVVSIEVDWDRLPERDSGADRATNSAGSSAPNSPRSLSEPGEPARPQPARRDDFAAALAPLLRIAVVLPASAAEPLPKDPAAAQRAVQAIVDDATARIAAVLPPTVSRQSLAVTLPAAIETATAPPAGLIASTAATDAYAFAAVISVLLIGGWQWQRRRSGQRRAATREILPAVPVPAANDPARAELAACVRRDPEQAARMLRGWLHESAAPGPGVSA